MELKGKAKEAFLKHSIGKEIALFEAMLPIYQHALIIEWLDSVGIYVDVEFFRKDVKDEAKFVSSTTDFKNGFQPLCEQFNSRQQATERAIERAIELFNERSDK